MKADIPGDKNNRRQTQAYRKIPRLIVVNEDSVSQAALSGCAGWGFYHRGDGSTYKRHRMDWTALTCGRCGTRPCRFQTVPFDWPINHEHQPAFLQKIREITGGGA